MKPVEFQLADLHLQNKMLFVLQATQSFTQKE